MMRFGVRHVVGATVIVLAAATCGPDSTETSDGGDTSAQRSSESGDLVGTQSIDGFGTVLVDADGNALYTNEAESDGTVKCVDACADFWPPLEGTQDALPSAVDGIDGEFGIVSRPDGSDQVTLDGMPLYTFTDDQTPGTVSGDGFEDDFGGDHFVWHVVSSESDQPADDTDTDSDDGGDTDDNGGGGGYGY